MEIQQGRVFPHWVLACVCVCVCVCVFMLYTHVCITECIETASQTVSISSSEIMWKFLVVSYFRKPSLQQKPIFFPGDYFGFSTHKCFIDSCLFMMWGLIMYVHCWLWIIHLEHLMCCFTTKQQWDSTHLLGQIFLIHHIHSFWFQKRIFTDQIINVRFHDWD